MGIGLEREQRGVWYQGWLILMDRPASRELHFNQGSGLFDFQYNTPWQVKALPLPLSVDITQDDYGPVYIMIIRHAVRTWWVHAYAGPGKTGNGLQPPKIAVEFDPFLNLVPPPILPDPNVYPCPSYPMMCVPAIQICVPTIQCVFLKQSNDNFLVIGTALS